MPPLEVLEIDTTPAVGDLVPEVESLDAAPLPLDENGLPPQSRVAEGCFGCSRIQVSPTEGSASDKRLIQNLGYASELLGRLADLELRHFMHYTEVPSKPTQAIEAFTKWAVDYAKGFKDKPDSKAFENSVNARAAHIALVGEEYLTWLKDMGVSEVVVEETAQHIKVAQTVLEVCTRNLPYINDVRFEDKMSSIIGYLHDRPPSMPLNRAELKAYLEDATLLEQVFALVPEKSPYSQVSEGLLAGIRQELVVARSLSLLFRNSNLEVRKSDAAQEAQGIDFVLVTPEGKINLGVDVKAAYPQIKHVGIWKGSECLATGTPVPAGEPDVTFAGLGRRGKADFEACLLAVRGGGMSSVDVHFAISRTLSLFSNTEPNEN